MRPAAPLPPAAGRRRRDAVSDPRVRRLSTRWLFGVFASLLAVSLILHQLWWNGLEVRSPHFVVVVAAFWVLARPSSVVRFAVMSAAEVVAVAMDLPYVGDHTLVVFLIGVCVLAHLGWTAVWQRRLPTPGELFDTLAPFLRVALIIVYAAAAIAKMNTDFLDPQTSCAAPMSRKIIWFDPSLLGGTWQVTPAIWSTVLIEVALPVLLAVPRTRVVALVLGCGFHVVLALAGNVPFSALALALYVAFLPIHTGARLRAVTARQPRLQTTLRMLRAPSVPSAMFAMATGVWLLSAHLLSAQPRLRAEVIGDGTRAIIVVMVGVAGVLFLTGRHHRTDGAAVYPGSPRALRQPVVAIGIALLVVNAASPYLGLKTESTFTMFSNLRTEQGSWNHVFIPESVRIFGFQDQVVTVIATSDPVLADQSRAGTHLTRFEFDRYLRTHPGATVTWTTGDHGDTTVHSRGPVATTSRETLAEKLFHFKDVRPRERGDCG